MMYYSLKYWAHTCIIIPMMMCFLQVSFKKELWKTGGHRHTCNCQKSMKSSILEGVQKENDDFQLTTMGKLTLLCFQSHSVLSKMLVQTHGLMTNCIPFYLLIDFLVTVNSNVTFTTYTIQYQSLNSSFHIFFSIIYTEKFH